MEYIKLLRIFNIKNFPKQQIDIDLYFQESSSNNENYRVFVVREKTDFVSKKCSMCSSNSMEKEKRMEGTYLQIMFPTKNIYNSFKLIKTMNKSLNHFDNCNVTILNESQRRALESDKK